MAAVGCACTQGRRQYHFVLQLISIVSRSVFEFAWFLHAFVEAQIRGSIRHVQNVNRVLEAAWWALTCMRQFRGPGIKANFECDKMAGTSDFSSSCRGDKFPDSKLRLRVKIGPC
ncbi:hypothetical protein ABW21_db0202811 [Orbilia brochopaga]|nr:hypothetical protein ABW21_db0202811 [Drechslerella brochopaga]